MKKENLYLDHGSKWGIGINGSNIEVSTYDHPSYGKITLCDASKKELKKIGDMFIKASKKIKE